MELIIEFYKGLDTLNLIIFWGIIIVIILLLIFSIIMINKNNKLKKLVEINNKDEEELPIKKESISVKEDNNQTRNKEETNNLFIEKEQSSISEEVNQIDENVGENNDFNAEELVIEYNHKQTENYNNAYQEAKKINNNDIKTTNQMPTGPYQRNVLREMSLSQTSPIGINRQVRPEEKKNEMVKDLDESLNSKEMESTSSISESINKAKFKNIDETVKKDLTNINYTSPRRTEITNNVTSNIVEKEKNYQITKREIKDTYTSEHKISQPSTAKELLNDNQIISLPKTEKSSSEKYLEEVSKKLSEAEIPDELERTNYELQQEEDAIISYKELMEKKDTIQTIDEEDAVISIEELMNRANNNQIEEKNNKEDSKLYNITETEENDNFIKELKQFRNDL